MSDHIIATGLFVCALLAGGVAVILMLDGFVTYLQTDHWPSLSVLQLGYDTHLIKAHWFLAGGEMSWWLHDVLERIPVITALLGLTPVFWYLHRWLDSR